MFSAATKSARVATAANYIEDVFSTWLYTGNGSTQTITNGIDLSTYGGLVWVKRRNSGFGHCLADTARGGGYWIATEDAAAQAYDTTKISGFTSSGFSIGTDSRTGQNNGTYASWTFRKQPKFFDIVTFSTSGTLSTNRRISHSLGSVPGTIIVKRTNDVQSWLVYHRSTGRSAYLILDTTDASTSLTNAWGLTDPTSSDFGINENQLCYTNSTYVAYLFAHNAGGFGLTGSDNVISCGSFSGAQTINLGYEPQWVLVKGSDTATNWQIEDNMRGLTSDGTGSKQLYPNLSNAEANANDIKLNATGFETTSAWAGITGIYIAIRRGPMKTPTNGTSVFTPTTYTGDGTNPRTISLSFSPDLVINTPRVGTNVYPAHPFFDRLRGDNNSLVPVGTQAENGFFASAVCGFNSAQNSHTVGGTSTNYTGNNFVDYSFRRAPGFFDEVCYTGDNVSGRTVQHNLGTAPDLVFVKCRSTAGLDWYAYGRTGNTNQLAGSLNNTWAFSSFAGFSGFTQQPTSQYLYLSSGADETNGSGKTYVAYLFGSVAGVSKVGTYTGTGALQTINCGFTSGARFVLIKRTDSTGDWWVYDSARGITSGNDPYFFMNSPADEVTGTNYVDTDTTGFKVTAAAPAGLNASGGTYIFLAIA